MNVTMYDKLYSFFSLNYDVKGTQPALLLCRPNQVQAAIVIQAVLPSTFFGWAWIEQDRLAE
jgi:hypothetical protein